MTDNKFELLRTANYSEFIHKSRYARWLELEGRREDWDETIHRYVSYFKNKLQLDDDISKDITEYITNFKVMPSMRALMSAGIALEKDQVAGYNCSYVAINDVKTFDEIMYILMCGTGVGFSVERQYIAQLPELPDKLYPTSTTIVPEDSKIGWATAYRELFSLLYSGKVPKWDLSKIRPAGSKLKTFGGRASGPDPLDDLFKFTVGVFKNASGKRLTSIECHDLVCKIASIVIAGGVRRSALISLSNLSDDRMRTAKSGAWWNDNTQRALANNSVCYTEKPSMDSFIKEWLSLYESKSGERGIYNRDAAVNLMPQRRQDLGTVDVGCNPCSEITLRDAEFCNLTEVIVREEDTLNDLRKKVRLATILGTIQSTITDFRYLRKEWQINCEEERLLGVSLTGIMDHPVLNGEAWLRTGDAIIETWLDLLKDLAIQTNIEWAEKLGIEPSAAITCVKPSGTVSQLTDTASGIHPRYSKYYIRTVRADKKDPLAIMMKELGVPVEDDVMSPTNLVFSFPIESPDSAVFRDDRTAIEQLEIWKLYQLKWCEHKPSITVYVKESEWLEVAAWVYKYFDVMSGVSFLPHTEHSYQQAPYQEIDEEKYRELKENEVVIDWDLLKKYELTDETVNTKELACTAGACEI